MTPDTKQTKAQKRRHLLYRIGEAATDIQSSFSDHMLIAPKYRDWERIASGMAANAGIILILLQTYDALDLPPGEDHE